MPRPATFLQPNPHQIKRQDNPFVARFYNPHQAKPKVLMVNKAKLKGSKFILTPKVGYRLIPDS
jgi:hypothetical protein